MYIHIYKPIQHIPLQRIFLYSLYIYIYIYTYVYKRERSEYAASMISMRRLMSHFDARRKMPLSMHRRKCHTTHSTGEVTILSNMSLHKPYRYTHIHIRHTHVRST